MTLFPTSGDSADAPTRAPSRRAIVGQALIIAAILGTVLWAISPTPYVVEKPGPVFNTIGTTEVDGEQVPVIEVDGADTYPTEGRLDLLTVYLEGSPENRLDWFDVIAAWFNPTRAILPLDAVYPEGQTDEEADEESALDMQQSQQSAIAAALTELDIDYGSVVTVGSVSPGTPADGVLEPGDELLTVDGAPVTDDAALRAGIAAAGVGTPVVLGIRRDGTEQLVTLTPIENSDADPRPVVGIVPSVAFDFPFDVTIQLQDVGGPSAGMMFAIGIYDTLTPGALAAGEHIAGTGTIDPDGTVGPIGGIRQKMFGAQEAGADWFLAPADNCAEVVGHVPDGLTVFSVSTLDEAIDIVSAIGEGAPTDGFAGCSA